MTSTLAYALAWFAVVIMFLVLASRPRGDCGCPYIERVGARKWPMPPLSRTERRENWRAKYQRVPLEQQIAPGGYFNNETLEEKHHENGS